MFRFNLLITFRQLWKNRLHSVLNIAGFALGLLCTLILLFYIQEEQSYDSFHADADKIYRVLRTAEVNGDQYDIGVTSGPYGPALMTDFPGQIASFVRIAPRERLMSVGEKHFREEHVFYADTNFFSFFSFPLLRGDAKTVLAQPNSIVLGESMAEKYFGTEDPIGQTVMIDNEHLFQVTGIMGKAAAKSHLEMDCVASIQFYRQENFMNRWWWNSLLTYAKIDNPAEAARIEAGFPAFMDKYFEEDFIKNGSRIDLKLEPLALSYFHREMRFDMVRHGNKKTVNILGLAAIAILLIACFNYINLAIAASHRRAREVGIRKVLGSHPRRIAMQFLGEALTVILLSVLLAVIGTTALLPLFNQYFGLEVAINWRDSNILGLFAVLIAAMLLLSAVLPATILARFRPVESLKGKVFTFSKYIWLRKGLVVVQFGISIFLIIGTLLIQRQISFIENKDLGFDGEAVMLIQADNDEIAASLPLFEEQLLEKPEVLSVSTMTGPPGGFHDGTSISTPERSDPMRIRTALVDHDYLETFGIEVSAGRNFSREHVTDMGGAALLNETAARELGWTAEEAIGKMVSLPMFDTTDRQVIGLVKDYHFASLHDEIEPLVIALSERPWLIGIRLDATKLAEGIALIEEKWKAHAPHYPISYTFADESLARLYESEQKQSKVFSTFSMISIFLACLGIFGLVSHATLERRKEISIRKVLGAKVKDILALVSKEFVLLIAISCILSTPVVIYFIQDWLEAFAYRIELGPLWYFFLLGGLIALLIALGSIGWLALRAAVRNPADSLRNE